MENKKIKGIIIGEELHEKLIRCPDQIAVLAFFLYLMRTVYFNEKRRIINVLVEQLVDMFMKQPEKYIYEDDNKKQ